MKQFIGWLLLGAGLVFAVGASINARSYSELQVNSIYRVYAEMLARDDSKIDKEDLRSALAALASVLDGARRTGYIFVSGSMAIGAILVSKSRATPLRADV